MKKAGILLPISSLPNRFGIGSLGDEAHDFIDFLQAAGQSYWQVLPIGCTSYGDSPYQTLSAYAGNPYFISLDRLLDAGLIDAEMAEEQDEFSPIDYGDLFVKRNAILDTIDLAGINKKDFNAFCDKNAQWLDDFAMFTTLKRHHAHRPWYEWSRGFKFREPQALQDFAQTNAEKIEKIKAIQFLFFKQFHELKNYANSRGIELIGDMPIYVAYDSVEVWAQPQLFDLDQNLNMRAVAGVPPDAFSDDGQLWGNPLYNWEYLKQTEFKFWIQRISAASELFDLVRIDHFRGFESYFAIPNGATTAKDGEWLTAPGQQLFATVNQKLNARIIAEDLGIITPEVEKLLTATGYPGMRVLQFAFDGNPKNTHLPENYIQNTVAYTGTHDNDTVMGWFESLPEQTQDHLDKTYFKGTPPNIAMIEALYASPAETVIIPIQDFLGLGSEARINTPSVPNGNWKWRLPEPLTDHLADAIREATKDFLT